jgi:hypothetical protein
MGCRQAGIENYYLLQEEVCGEWIASDPQVMSGRRPAAQDSAQRFGEVLREIEAEGIELPSPIAATRLQILDGLPARRNHDPAMGARRYRRQGAAASGFKPAPR